ncbi:MAG: hypothetical protein ABL949_01715 [Fimbriimonadaceae bacterium]
MLGVLSFYVLGLAQTEITFTYTCKAKPIHAVLAEFSKETGIKVKARAVGERPLVLKVDKMHTRRFLDEVAKVVHGKWKQDGEWLVLDRDGDWASRLQILGIEARAKSLERSMAENVRLLSQSTDFSDGSIKSMIASALRSRDYYVANPPEGGSVAIQVGDGKNPCSYFLLEAMKKLSPKELASLGPNEMKVYSSAPNRFQYALPYRPEASGQYLAAREKLATVMKKLPPSDLFTYYVGNSYSGPGQKAKGKYAKFLLRARNLYQNYIYLDLFVVSESGEVLDQLSMGVTPQPMAHDHGFRPTTVTLSPESWDLVQALRFDYSDPSGSIFPVANWTAPKLSSRAKEILLSPESHEPLSYHVSEVLLAFATNAGKQLIAAPPDNMVPLVASWFPQSKGTAYPSNFNVAGADYEVESDLIEISANGIYGSSEVSRPALGTLMRQMHSQGYANFSDLEEFTEKSGAFGSIQGGGLDASYVGSVNSRLISMLGGITPTAFMAHKGLGVRKMPVGKVTVSPSASWPKELVPAVYRQILRNMGGAYFPGTTEIDHQEITEVLGKLDTTQLQMKVSRQLIDLAFATDERGNHAFLPAYSVVAMKTKYKTYRMAKGTSDHMIPTIGEAELSPIGYLQDVQIVGTKELTFDELPKDFIKQAGQSLRVTNSQQFSPRDSGYRPRIPPSP